MNTFIKLLLQILGLTDEPTLPRQKKYQEDLTRVLKIIDMFLQMTFFDSSILKFWMC